MRKSSASGATSADAPVLFITVYILFGGHAGCSELRVRFVAVNRSPQPEPRPRGPARTACAHAACTASGFPIPFTLYVPPRVPLSRARQASSPNRGSRSAAVFRANNVRTNVETSPLTHGLERSISRAAWARQIAAATAEQQLRMPRAPRPYSHGPKHVERHERVESASSSAPVKFIYSRSVKHQGRGACPPVPRLSVEGGKPSTLRRPETGDWGHGTPPRCSGGALGCVGAAWAFTWSMEADGAPPSTGQRALSTSRSARSQSK
jgi:hypothetical protein